MRALKALVLALLLLPFCLTGAQAAFGLPGPSQLILDLIGRFSGGMVQTKGVTGWPNALHIDHFELRDAKGAWLIADDVTLDWHPYRLAFKDAEINKLTVGKLQIPRLQESTPGAKSSSGLPVTVEIKQLDLAHIELGAPVAGVAGVFSASGSLDLPSLEAPTAHLVAHRLDGGGDYKVDAEVTKPRIDATIAVAEPAHGFIAQVAKLPDIGALKLDATASGPRTALATDVKLAAGPLNATANGDVNLVGSSLNLQVAATAPAMKPAPGVAWQAVQLHAHVQGPFTKPDADGHLQVDALSASGAAIQQLAADLSGNAGHVAVHAVATGVRIPGPDPGLLETAPLTIDAAARLDDAARPVTFKISHPLLQAEGQARTAAPIQATADIALARLAPFAAIAGVDLHGRTALHLKAAVDNGTASITGDGNVSITGGLAPVPGLVGEGATLGLTASMAGQTITLSRLTLDGKTLKLNLTASKTGQQVKADGTVALSDLSVVAPTVSGNLTTTASVTGALGDLAVTAHSQGDVGAQGVPRGPVKLDVALHALPSAPAGTIEAQGQLAGAPLKLAVDAERSSDGAVQVKINRADWRSLHARGALRLPAGAKLPLGQVQLRLQNLGDLRPFVGKPLTGAVDATLDLGAAEARLSATAHDAGIPGTKVGDATIKALVRDPLKAPVVTASAQIAGLAAAGVTGSAKLDVTGPQSALAIRSDANLVLSGTPAQIAAEATLNLPGKKVQLRRLLLDAKGQTAHLLAPSTVSFGDGLAVDRLRVGLQQAVLDLSGRLSPRLNASLTLRAPADIAAIAAPSLALDGQIAVNAKLTGTPAQPGGSIRLAMTGLRARTGPGRAVPPANVTATATLHGRSATIDARATAGSAQVRLAGEAPLGAGALDLRASGGLNLALLDPILTATGRQALGRLTLDATIRGTTSAPQIGGTARLAAASVQDFTQGLRIHDINATVRGDGRALRIVSFSGRAGPGTISASGTVGITAPGMPIDLTLRASDAAPIASDMLQMNVDANLTLRGQARGRMDAAGRVLIRRAEIQIPATLPSSVAALKVIRPGQKPATPSAGPAPQVNLDLVVDAPQQVFVRGRGLEAEMSGRLRIQGDASKPKVSGGFDMRQGQLSLAGTTLQFSHGRVGFDGTGPGGKIDPTLDFIAAVTANSVTATLTIGGYASAPKITLTSVPALPQDEVLSYLLFRQSIKNIGPFQIASIAASLAELTGVGGTGGLNPLGRIRTGLGLDRLNVGGSSTGTGATVEAGKYVANGVYLGAKQGTSSDTGTGATLQIDITKGLKLQTDVGTGRGGNQVGLTYQFEY